MAEPSDQLPFNRFNFHTFLLVSTIYQFVINLLMVSLGINVKWSFSVLLCFDSELVIIFLKFLYDQDPVRQLLELSEVDSSVEVDL